MVDSVPIQRRLNDPVTEHMRTDFARLHFSQTVDEALLSLRGKSSANEIVYLYVVDDNNLLMGVVPARRLLLSRENTPLIDIMVQEVITMSRITTILDACEMFISHRLLAFPVVDERHRLLGVVDVDLYAGELRGLDRREGNDELFQLIGVQLADAKHTSPLRAFQSRFPWLLANIGGGILAAFLSGVFKAELEQVVTLALFIPVVLALAESVSIQSVTLALQALRGKQPTMRMILKKLQSEVVTGLFLGVTSSMVVGAVSLVWLGQVGVMVCLVGGIAGGVTCAAVIGAAMPNLLRFFRRDPQVAAGPIALACTDMVTLLIYFSLARLLLR